MILSLNRFFKSFNFLKAIVLALAMILPIFLSKIYFNDLNFGFSIALGVLFCSPADVPGSVKHNFYGILIASVMSFIITLVFGFAMNSIWLMVPLLCVSVFLVSYLSVFGFRASLISFSGLLAIVLSFANDYNEVNLLTHSGLVLLGGLWYLGLSLITSILFPKVQTDYLFTEVLEKTAEFLKLRGDLLIASTDRNKLYKKMFQLQTEITDKQEVLRTIILRRRKSSGFSNRIRRQQLFFSELIDILELAISNPVDYDKFDTVFEKHHEKLEVFKDLLYEMSSQLHHISKVIRKEEKLKSSDKFNSLISTIERDINYYRILIGLPKSRQGTLMLLNLKNYQEKQLQKIIGLERILGNYIKNNKITKPKDAERFITPQDYDIRKLKTNFSFKSPIFKHSLRLSIVVLLGFVMGMFFEMQNPYWILLTIIVIMRPSYGLTKERSINRVLGTLIGAVLAAIIILITQNTTVYAIIAILALPLAFSIMQHNYRNGAIFITLNVIFVFAIVEPNILSVIKYRIFDTVIGASLSFTAIHFLWPSWQFQNINEFFADAISANKYFLKQIDSFYHTKGEVPIKYKLSRKEAFLAIGNLNAAFERMNQDPKSKQKDYSVIYELIVVNNTFLSSLSSLGTFIRNNNTSKAPVHFEIFIENICSNLNLCIEILENENFSKKKSVSNVEKALELYDSSFEDLSNKRDQEILEGIEVTVEMVEQLKETHLVSEQVKWLFNLSEKMVSSVETFTLNLKKAS